MLLVGLPLCPSGVFGGPAALPAEGCWALVLWVFPCCVRLWCRRCSRFGVLCLFVGLVLVVAVVVYVVCARLCVWCVGGAFGCLSSPLWAWFGGSVWVRGLCVVVPLPSLAVGPGCGSPPLLAGVCWWWCVPPLHALPLSFSLPGRLARCSPRAVPGPVRAVVGVRWGRLGAEASLTLARVPSSGVSPLGGRMLALPVRV